MINILLRNVIHHASVFRNDAVVLFNAEDWGKALCTAGLYMPTGTENGGRTWRLPNGSKVTIAQYADAPLASGTYCVAAYKPEIGYRSHLNEWLKFAKKELAWQ